MFLPHSTTSLSCLLAQGFIWEWSEQGGRDMGTSPPGSACLSCAHTSLGTKWRTFPILSCATEISPTSSPPFQDAFLPWSLLWGLHGEKSAGKETDLSLREDKLRGMAKILYCTFINIYKYYITNYFSYARQRLDKICIEWNYLHYKEFITTLKKTQHESFSEGYLLFYMDSCLVLSDCS